MERTVIAMVLGWLWIPAVMAASVPLDVSGGVEAETEARERGRLHWDLESAHAALRQGFPGLAARFFDAALEGGLSGESRRAVLLPHASALIALGKFERAAVYLEEYPEKGSAGWLLRRAYVDAHTGRGESARERLSRFPPSDLEVADRAWFFLLDALLRIREGDTEGATARFEQARQLASTSTQRTHFEILRIRAEMERGLRREENISELRATERAMRGQRGGFEAARLLAIALQRDGRTSDAVEVIDRQLQAPGLAETGLRPTFLLLMGVISGEDTGRGRLALRQLVLAEADRELREIALHLLAYRPLADGGPAEFDGFLSELLEEHPEHPLRDQFLALRALRRASAGLFEEAEADALRLPEEFPGSPLVDHAYRLLAYLNWSREPPRYRTAADFLNRLRADLAPGAERARLGVLMADSYFKNRDYGAASDVYAEVFREIPEADRSGVILPWVVADIRSGRLDRARRTMDEPEVGTVDPAVRWRAEWNLIDAMRRGGESAEALARVGRLVRSEGAKQSADLAVRFRWLEARLALDAGEPLLALERARDLLSFLETVGGEVEAVAPGAGRGGPALVVDPEPVPVASHILLLKGEALFSMGETEAGNAVFADLRERYPASGPAILSHLISARDFGAGDGLAAAQQTLRQLADEFRGSPYAPIALWETAIYAERRGTNSALRDAVTTLEDLIQRYPGHPLSFYARLKQADISRKLNDFGSALMLYERMLRDYPDHPGRFRIEMGRGDCLLARGSVDEGSLEDAVLVYERLLDLPLTPDDARVEAGVKLALARRLLGRREEAERTLWMVRTRFDPAEREEIRLERQGRYWYARALLELAAAAEAEGNQGGARQLYAAILEGGLPGGATARARLERFE